MIRGLDQVSLRVTISEIRRDVSSSSASATPASASASSGFGPACRTQSSIPSASTARSNNTADDRLDAWPARSSPPRSHAFEQQGVAHTLAEPTVTAISGERAKFLAGGTIPIPSSETCHRRRLHARLHPAALRRDAQLHAGRAEPGPHPAARRDRSDRHRLFQVRSRSRDTTIPGFRTRRNETTVELPSGGSIVSAGLISTQSNQAITGLPGLMNLPVLGALFRSRDYQRQETELLIIVTPYIVHAVDPQGRRAARPEFRRRQRSAGLAARPRQPHLFELRRPAADAQLHRQSRFHHRLKRLRNPGLISLCESTS